MQTAYNVWPWSSRSFAPGVQGNLVAVAQEESTRYTEKALHFDSVLSFVLHESCARPWETRGRKIVRPEKINERDSPLVDSIASFRFSYRCQGKTCNVELQSPSPFYNSHGWKADAIFQWLLVCSIRCACEHKKLAHLMHHEFQGERRSV